MLHGLIAIAVIEKVLLLCHCHTDRLTMASYITAGIFQFTSTTCSDLAQMHHKSLSGSGCPKLYSPCHPWVRRLNAGIYWEEEPLMGLGVTWFEVFLSLKWPGSCSSLVPPLVPLYFHLVLNILKTNSSCAWQFRIVIYLSSASYYQITVNS